MISDKEYFFKDWQRLMLKDPTLFSAPARRYIRHLTDDDKTMSTDLRVSEFGLLILQFLAKNPHKRYIARDILRESSSGFTAGNKHTESVQGTAASIQKLVKNGYVSENELKPQGYQITAKGLKFLNQLIGDYDD